MDDNKILLNFACELYCAGHLEIIQREAASFVSGDISRETQAESLHHMRTSSRRIIEIIDAYTRFAQQKFGKRVRKPACLLLKSSSSLRNLDMMLMIVNDLQRERSRNEDEAPCLESFHTWLLQKRDNIISDFCEYLDKDICPLIERSAVKLDFKFMFGYDHKSTACYTLREAAAAIYFRSAADILAARSRCNRLHALRIECKGFRYLLELFELSGIDSYQAQSEFKTVQDIFGTWHDDYILLQNLSKYSKGTNDENNQKNCLKSVFVEREKVSRSKAEEVSENLSFQWFNSAFASMFLGK